MTCVNMGIACSILVCLFLAQAAQARTETLRYCESALVVTPERKATSIEVAKKLADTLLKLQTAGEPVYKERSSIQLVDPRHAVERDVEGIPKYVKKIDPTGCKFRHYVRSKKDFESILRNKVLASAFIGYVETGFYRDSFLDITGVFFTDLVKFAVEVGVSERETYGFVDVEISSDIPVFEVQGFSIFFVPLPKRLPPFILEDYRKYKKGEALKPNEQALAEKIDRAGGVAPSYMIPVTVVRSEIIKK